MFSFLASHLTSGARVLGGFCAIGSTATFSQKVVFADTDFPVKSSEALKSRLENSIKQYQDIVHKIESLQLSEATIENTFCELFQADGFAQNSCGELSLPSMVAECAELRSESSKAKAEYQKLWSWVYTRPGLYQILKSVSDAECPIDAREWYATQKVLRNFERNGCGLDNDIANEFAKKLARIAELEMACVEAVNEDTTFLSFSREELEGVSETFINGLEEIVFEEKTYYKVTLKRPHMNAVLSKCKNPEIRKALQTAAYRQCQKKNEERLTELFALRHQIAIMQGYKSHAERKLKGEIRMASNPEVVEGFLLAMINRWKPVAEADYALLLSYKQQETPEATRLELWDYLYYSNVIKERKYNIDQEKIREYFPLEHVISETLDIYANVLQLKIEPIEEPNVWHPDVRAFSVKDARSGEVIGEFYLDVFQRDGKYGHQCVYPVRGSFSASGKKYLPAVTNIGNLSKPTKDRPSLLRFSEVITFFHEFGHVCHAILTNTNCSINSWTWPVVPCPGGVEMDFLEIPSMMFQEWVYHRKVLDRLSRHYKSGEPLPKEQLDKLIELRRFDKGNSEIRYLSMALFDLIAHSSSPPYEYNQRKDLSVAGLFNEIMLDVANRPAIPDSNYVASWYHMIQGYDVGYYGYLWAEVFAHDINGEFMPDGMEGDLKLELGESFRREVLEPGASRPAGELLRNFLGREPNDKAYLASYDLLDN